MENKSTNDETFSLVSFLVNRALNDPNGPEAEKIVLADECGDTMWDAVLQQEEKTVTKNAAVLLNRIDSVQVCDATEVE